MDDLTAGYGIQTKVTLNGGCWKTSFRYALDPPCRPTSDPPGQIRAFTIKEKELRVRGAQGHLALDVSAVCAASLGIGELAHGQSIGGFLRQDTGMDRSGEGHVATSLSALGALRRERAQAGK